MTFFLQLLAYFSHLSTITFFRPEPLLWPSLVCWKLFFPLVWKQIILIRLKYIVEHYIVVSISLCLVPTLLHFISHYASEAGLWMALWAISLSF